MSEPSESSILQLKVVLLGISPMIWRRILVHRESSIADLHATLQITMGWRDSHLHRFLIHGKEYGIAQIGGISFRNHPDTVKLSDFGFRRNERFLYEYDFGDLWQHQIRLEAILAAKPNQFYPVCIAGRRSGLPEDCGGPWRWMERQQHYSIRYVAEQLLEIIDSGDMEDHWDEVAEWRDGLKAIGPFDRRAVNLQLMEYSKDKLRKNKERKEMA